MRGIWITGIKLTLALTVVGSAYFFNLGYPSLWGDEAGTGLFARNVLQFGVPTGFDGRNLSIYEGGTELNAQLLVVKIPWIQFYLAALSLQVFGDTTQGLRTIFALSGMVALFPIWACLRKRVPMPLLLATVILLTPQVILFHRNARYYAVLTLLFALTTWLVCAPARSRRIQLGLCTTLMTLMFHTHPVAAISCGLTLLLHAAWHRANFSMYLLACVFGLSSWLLWLYVVGPTLIAPLLFADFRGQEALTWPSILARNVFWSFADVDAVQGMPLLAWAIGIVSLSLLAPKRLASYFKDPLVGFVLLALVVHVLLVATAFGTETEQHMGLLRYMPHLIALALAPLFILVAQLLPKARLLTPVCMALVASNLFTLSYWRATPNQTIPLSWWTPTYLEIAFPHPEAFDVARQIIESDVSLRSGGLQTLAVHPQWLQENAIYYLGHKLIVQPQIEPGSSSEAAVRARIGDAALARLRPNPTWVIYEYPGEPPTVPGYNSVRFELHRMRPDDGTRPELTRHTFYTQQVIGYATLYRRVD